MRKNKTLLKTLLSVTLVICFSRPVFATETYSWYFKPTTDGTQPVCTPEANFIDEYDMREIVGDSPSKSLISLDTFKDIITFVERKILSCDFSYHIKRFFT